MADELVEQQVQEIAPAQQDTVPQEVREMMELSLNGGMPQTKQEEQTVNTGGSETTSQADTPEETVVDANEYLKTNLGFETWEAAKTELETLRQKAQTAAEIKYENELSEKLAKAFQAGKVDEVYEYLDQQKRLDKYLNGEVNEETAADIIKLGMRLNHKELTDDEINYKFNKTYGIPKEPVQGAVEDDEAFEERKQEWQEKVEAIRKEKIIDAKLAKPQLEAAKQKLVIPNIESAIDEGYLQYKKELEEFPQRDAETKAAYKSFTTKALETKLSFNDEANKIQFEFQFEPDAEGFQKAVEVVSDQEKYFALYQNPDGSPNRLKFLQDTYFALNREKVIAEAIKQAKNATMKQTLLADNSGGGIGSKQLPQMQEPNELDKQMKASLSGYL